MKFSVLGEIEKLIEQGQTQSFYDDVRHLVYQENRLVLKSIEELKGKRFLVEDYQRGYKWTEDQVMQLLEDINSYEKDSDGFYCLQPVVVKRIEKQDHDLQNSVAWELIDGQQRLTTIYFILAYLQQEVQGKPFYSIEYNTRPSSRQFLNKKDLFNDVRENVDWSLFQKSNPDYNNSDVYHFFNALKTIKNYFEDTNHSVDKDSWCTKLKSHAKVIWYEAESCLSVEDDREAKHQSIEIFSRLNSGKIPLESSELIKAVLLNKLNEEYAHLPDLVETKKRELIMQWDAMEHQLHDKDFWAFLMPVKARRDNPNPPVRIDLIFDTLFSSKSKTAYFVIQDEISSSQQTVSDIWNQVQDTFNRFYEWYSQDELFHLVGFHLTQGLSTLSKVLKESKEKPRSEFKLNLKRKISGNFLKVEKNDSDSLGWKTWEYTNASQKKKIEKLLILFNIALHQQTKTRFPFDLQVKWTLEHIHAQNQKPLEREEKQKLLAYYQDEDYSSVGGKEVDDIFNELFRPDEDSVQQVGNLTLLSQSLNSSIGNEFFAFKRKEILKEEDEYVPLGTLQVFSKAYSKNNVQMSVWSEEDQEDYIAKIETVIKRFIEETAEDKGVECEK